MLSPALKQYAMVTGNYWAFTLTDGALRMLVVLHFYQLGYSPFAIAMLFVFYEFFGVITNLCGGYLGALIGLNRTMNIGIGLQILALAMLLVPAESLTVPWVMLAQALSGIAKDLNKMSAKTAIKTLVSREDQGQLFRWVAILTGSKNTLKGLGFFAGSALLTLVGFNQAILLMVIGLSLVWAMSLCCLKQDLGKATAKPKFSQIFAKTSDINYLSAARLFLFGARDLWFVIALPVFLSQKLGWDHYQVGAFLASWIIGYGLIQSMAPAITAKVSGQLPDGHSAMRWAFALAIVPLLIALCLYSEFAVATSLIIGLMIFGALFAINSSIHSYLIVSYARADGASLDIGFYYMANALGRLTGTVLSGWVFQQAGLIACLLISGLFIFIAGLISLLLPRDNYHN
jgi:predicted MFS family arabinose efflux permease